MNSRVPLLSRLSRRTEWLIFAAILIGAAFLRLYRLDAIPPGWTHDEAGHGHDAISILNGARPIYETVGYGREPLYDYLTAGLMALIGPTGLALRLVSVISGLATLLVTFAWVRMAFDDSTALAAAAFQAASFWSLTTSRQALRSSLLPALFTAAVYFYWRSIYGARQGTGSEPPSRPHRWQIGFFALLIGATLYTYLPARVTWIVFIAFLVYLAICRRADSRRVWLATLIAVSVGLLLSAPMFIWLGRHPGAEQRLTMLDVPLRALENGNVSVILDRAWSGLSAFFIPGHGDDFLAYTIPGRPFLDPLTGVLFLAGVGLCLIRWREPAHAFSLLWLLIGVSPTLATGASASITRSIAALPVVFLFPALAVVTGTHWAARHRKRWAALATMLGSTALILITGAVSARDYFAWGELPDVRAAYQHTLVEIAHHLDAGPEEGTVAISTVYPQAPHDPYIFELSLRRRDLALRWFDARAALVLPSKPTARLIVPYSTPIDPYFAGLPGLRVREHVELRADDLDPSFSVYDWELTVTLAALKQRTQTYSPGAELPASLGNALQLAGYDLLTPQVAPGGTVELLTLWQVTDPQALPRDSLSSNTALVFFAHALDARGIVVGQQDRLDAPAWDWQAGDVIAQLDRFTIPPDLSPGSLALEVGAYSPTDLTRLPVLVNGIAVGDRILLQPVEVQ